MSRLSRSQMSIPTLASLAASASAPSTSSTPDDPAATQDRSNVVRRVMEMTADKLSRSKSLERRGQQGPSSKQQTSPRRVFSITRKGKEKQQPGDDARPSSRSKPSTPSTPSEPDESPFIRPPSPTQPPRRPSLQPFTGDGSMRAGTQTLIQALQAIPWEEDQDNEDDPLPNNLDPVDSDSDEDERPGQAMASSIHAIHRPVVMSRRQGSQLGLYPPITAASTKFNPSLPNVSTSPDTIGRSPSDEEEEELEEDFEAAPTPGRASPQGMHPMEDARAPMSALLEDEIGAAAARMASERANSLATVATVKTVKVNRRARLAAKLADVFELSGINEVIAEMPCWLLRSVLLQGFMYLTNSYVCFFAHMPSREDQVLKSGSLYKKAQRTKRWIKHWFILKNDVLSWYQSSADPYFPHGVVDLRYAIVCEPVGEKGIRLRTNAKTIHLTADSVPSREEWVKSIRKVIFKAQNMGDSVKIAIPYSTIIDVDKSSAMDFSETIEIKVVEGLSASEELSVDSYFFAYFHDLPAALEQIRDAIAMYSLRTRRSELAGGEGEEGGGGEMLIDTTSPRSPPQSNRNSRLVEEAGPGQSGQGQTGGAVASKTSSPFRLASFLRPFQEPSATATQPPQTPRSTISAHATATAVTPDLDTSEEFTHVRKRSSQSFIPITSSPPPSSVGGEFPWSTPPLSGSPGAVNVLPRSSSETGLQQSVGSLTPTPSTVGVGGGLGLTSTTGSPTPPHLHPHHPHGHTYPPATTADALNMPPVGGSFMSTSSSGISSNNGAPGTRPSAFTWGVGVPSWLKIPSRKSLVGPFGVGGGSGGGNEQGKGDMEDKGVSEVYTSTGSAVGGGGGSGDAGSGSGQMAGSVGGGGGGGGGTGGDMTFSILETPDWEVEAEMAGKFRNDFAFDERERLLGYFPGYIFRLLPVYGRLYISSNYLCFKATGPLATKTRLMLPIRDILATEVSKAFRFGHYGLVLIIKGHEELFFEFGLQDRRTAFVHLLNRQMEDVRARILSFAATSNAETPTTATGTGALSTSPRNNSFNGTVNASPRSKPDALFLEEFAPPRDSDETAAGDPRPSMTDSLPAVMFTSTSSTFLTFKPKESLRFTFLTIGSRGDVQPYISLAKGLMRDGHRVKIATHGEFQGWVESYGIEFGYVGGDPAELMRICVENGTFTVSFLREGVAKFRGWIDDLLKTAWEACQDTDVLIESPSAMAGYHIAEALRIPYFRAFTMTWSRTRAYPHAFAVPERKMGGSYNYMTYVMFDQVFWRGTASQINRWRRNILNLPSTSLDKMEPHKIPFLYNFSPTVVPPPLDWPEWIRVTGYWFLEDASASASKWTPPPDLVEFIDNAHALGKKVVYIGFGSIVVSDPKAMTRTVIEAIVQSGVHAILSKGWSDRLTKNVAEVAEPEEPLPKQIYPLASVPHDWLFKRIDAACHHGGAGTTGASLRAGIPTIIKPFFGDQFFWADRVEALGVGSGVRKLTVESLAEALGTATTDERQITRAKVIGEAIRSENGVATAVEAIYRDLEYARSLVKGTVSPDDVIVEGTSPSSGSPGDSGGGDTEDESPDHDKLLSSPPSGSIGGAPSEDWSVISDLEEPSRLSLSSTSRQSEGRERRISFKRSGITATMLSVLPGALTTPAVQLTHRRSRSDGSCSASTNGRPSSSHSRL